MGQICTTLAPVKDENQNVQTLRGVRPEKCLTGHATRSTATQCQYMMPTLARMIERKPALKILDVGCGTASITADFALAAPHGEVVGLDLSGSMLETAKVHAQSEGAGVKFLQGNVHQLPFPDKSFDVVHTHQSVAHFTNPTMAIKEMIRVTKKGGVLCMREGDLRTASFSESPLLEDCVQLIMKIHELNGGATDAGAKLEAWLVDAGVSKNCITATQSVCNYNTPEERKDYGGHWPARCTYGTFADLAVDLGISSVRLEEYALAWRKWMDGAGGAFTMTHGEVIARL